MEKIVLDELRKLHHTACIDVREAEVNIARLELRLQGERGDLEQEMNRRTALGVVLMQNGVTVEELDKVRDHPFD